MAVPQKDVIKRLKAGETLVHVIEREKKSGNHKPYQYLSGGGQGNRCDLRKAPAAAVTGERRVVPGCRTSGMGVVR